MFSRETLDDGFSLSTPRLTLRWPRLADCVAIERLAGRKSVAEMTALIPHPYPEGASDQFVFAARLANARGDGLTLAITEARKPSELIGVVAIQPPTFSDEEECASPFLGFWLGAEHWGRGYGSEAVSALVELTFNEIDADVIGAETLSRNAAALRLLEKTGFTITGTGVSPFPARGGLLPVTRLERRNARAMRISPGEALHPANDDGPAAIAAE